MTERHTVYTSTGLIPSTTKVQPLDTDPSYLLPHFLLIDYMYIQQFASNEMLGGGLEKRPGNEAGCTL